MKQEFLEQWSRLGEYLSSHMLITLIPLLLGVMVGLPLALAIVRYKKLQWSTLAVVSVIQTIPGLALLALMVPLLVFAGQLTGLDLPSFGFVPAAIALTLYSLLPIVRNTVTGLSSVDRALLEAATALGMTRRQVLFKVQFPLAAPVILAGIRTATVWVVGTATLATPVGQTSLGNYIFSGLQTRTWMAVIFGCVAAAFLAIVLDVFLGLIEKGWSQRKKAMGWIGAIGLVFVFAVGLFPSIWSFQSSPENEVLIGSKTFTEQYILAELLELRLNQAGIPSRRVESLGSTIAFDATMNNDIDMYVDYSGTIWTNYMKETQRANPATVVEQTAKWVHQTYGGLQLGALGFENTYALAMREEDAEKINVKTIEQLSAKAKDLTIGGDYEFFERPEWTDLVDRYGLKFARNLSFDSTFMYEAIKAQKVDVISAFSSDGRIAAYDLRVLEDNRKSFPPYDAVLLLSPDAAKRKKVLKALSAVIGNISIQLMQEANKKVDVDGESPSEAAKWLSDQISNQP